MPMTPEQMKTLEANVRRRRALGVNGHGDPLGTTYRYETTASGVHRIAVPPARKPAPKITQPARPKAPKTNPNQKPRKDPPPMAAKTNKSTISPSTLARIERLERAYGITPEPRASSAALPGRLPPDQKRELDRRMGLLGGTETRMEAAGTRLVLGAPAAEDDRYRKQGEDGFRDGFNQPKRDSQFVPPERDEEWWDKYGRWVPPPTEEARSRLAPEAKAELDRRMGLRDSPRVTATPYRLTIG